MKNLSPAELAVVANVDRDRVTEDLAALVAIPSITGSDAEAPALVRPTMTRLNPSRSAAAREIAPVLARKLAGVWSLWPWASESSRSLGWLPTG